MQNVAVCVEVGTAKWGATVGGVERLEHFASIIFVPITIALPPVLILIGENISQYLSAEAFLPVKIVGVGAVRLGTIAGA